MQLSFTTHIDNQPNYFVAKIWLSLWTNKASKNKVIDFMNQYHDKFSVSALQLGKSKIGELNAKKHTIREDKADRWKVGNKIHFVINPYSKDRFQFAPIIEVISTQNIKIEWSENSTYPFIKIWNEKSECILNPLDHFDYISQLEDLAINDGFDNFEEFLKYFDKDFEGKIIHWTNEKY